MLRVHGVELARDARRREERAAEERGEAREDVRERVGRDAEVELRVRGRGRRVIIPVMFGDVLFPEGEKARGV